MVRGVKIPHRLTTASIFCTHSSSQSPTLTRAFHYRYEPLRPNEIRLIDLHPGHTTDPIRFRFRETLLWENALYESLSYCWGTKKSEAEIHCDDGHILVTNNLLSALQQLRRDESIRTLWVDAVCIDQDNVGERSHQVNLMRDIFSLSQQTVVWLGPESSNSHRAVELIQKLAAASRDHRPAWRSRKSTPIPSLYDPAWRAFSELLQRPWFHRAWIVQEASVTRDLLLLCGKHFIAWNDLVHAVQYAVDMGVFVAHGGSTSFQALKLFETRTDFQAHRLPSLHNVLLRSRSFRATDPRDKVFGLLSLADPTSVESMGLQPDYFLTTEQLYKKVSHALLGRADLDAFHASKVSADNDLPSWVADWSCSDPSIPLTSSQNPQFVEKSLVAANETFFCAAGTSISSPIFDQGGRLLGLKGILIDQIDEVGLLSRTRHLRHVSQLFLLFVQGRDILEQLKDWERVAQVSSRDPYPTGEGHMDAYWKTLCVGRVPQNASSARQDPRFKYYRMIRSLLSFMRIVVRWFPRPRKEVWYNRMYIIMFQTIWKGLGLTPAKIQRIGFPPESQLSNHRRMVKTKKGYTALAPRFAKTGDYVGLFKGGKMPLVVRKEGAEWILIGESYVHGVMKGERWNESGCTLMWFK